MKDLVDGFIHQRRNAPNVNSLGRFRFLILFIMGYTTTFTGTLKFKNEVNNMALQKLQTFLGEDVREHPEWDAEGSYIDLRITYDFSGIEWDDETEKNNGMVSHVNLILREMKKDFPNFDLEGQLLAQGEEPKDQWILTCENGVAFESKLEITGKFITCPNCDHEFHINTIEPNPQE